MMALSRVKGASIYVVPPPPVTELGTATGFDFMLQDRGGLGHEELSRGARPAASAWRPRTRASSACGPTACRTSRSTRSTSTGRGPGPSACRSARSRATSRRPSAAPTSTTSSRAAASSASTRRPTRRSACSRATSTASTSATAGAASSRSRPWPPAAGSTARRGSSATTAFPAMNIQGEPAPGHSSGDAMKAMEELTAKLPPGIGVPVDGPLLSGAHGRRRRPGCSTPSRSSSSSWSSRRSTRAGRCPSRSCWPCRSASSAASSPRRCAACRATSTSRSACSTVLGLTTKNAILIVQFAKRHLEQGMGLVEATSRRRSSACARSS